MNDTDAAHRAQADRVERQRLKALNDDLHARCSRVLDQWRERPHSAAYQAVLVLSEFEFISLRPTCDESENR